MPGDKGGLGRINVFNRVTIDAPRAEVYRALQHMGEWWPRRLKAGSRVVLECRVGGMFYEDCGGGDGVLYGQVSALTYNQRISIRGPMGIRGPVASVWSIELADEDEGRTRVHGSHRAFGDIDEDTSEEYIDGWGEVYNALRGYLGLKPSADQP